MKGKNEEVEIEEEGGVLPGHEERSELRKQSHLGTVE